MKLHYHLQLAHCNDLPVLAYEIVGAPTMRNYHTLHLPPLLLPQPRPAHQHLHHFTPSIVLQLGHDRILVGSYLEEE